MSLKVILLYQDHHQIFNVKKKIFLKTKYFTFLFKNLKPQTKKSSTFRCFIWGGSLLPQKNTFLRGFILTIYQYVSNTSKPFVLGEEREIAKKLLWDDQSIQFIVHTIGNYLNRVFLFWNWNYIRLIFVNLPANHKICKNYST